MPKVKKIVFPAISGFALSFFISILFTHKFGYSLLRGLLFGFVFAVLAVLIDIVYGKFLDDGSSVSEISQDSSKSDGKVGSHVDITIDDADLSNTGKEIPFAVNRNLFQLSESDTQDLRKIDILYESEQKEQKTVLSATMSDSVSTQKESSSVVHPADTNESSQDSSFKPVALGKPLEVASESSKNEKTESSQSKPADSVAETKNQLKKKAKEAEKHEIDALPDLEGFEGDDNYVSDNDIIENSDFAQESESNFSSSSGSIDGSTVTSNHDTETLAKAIHTVLKRDEMS